MELPKGNEAERAVLCSILLDNSVMAIARDILEPEDFFSREHQGLYKAMLKLDSEQKGIDAVTVGTRLKGLEEFNGKGTSFKDDGAAVSFVFDLTRQTAYARNIKTYCESVKNESMRRALGTYAFGITAKTKETIEDCAGYIGELRDSLDKIAGEQREKAWYRFGETAAEALADVEALSNGAFSGVMTGFTELDNMLAGLRAGSVTIVAARPGMGKTAFALNIACHAAIDHDIPCAIFSLEMTRKELAMRMISSISGVNSHAIRTGQLSHSQWDALFATVDKYSKAPIDIDDSPEMTIGKLRDHARRLKAESNIQLIVVDYLQLMTSTSKKMQNREQDVAEISRGMKSLAKELEIPVICLSQLNRANEQRQDKRPMLSDLRESGSIEQDADNILLIHRPGYYDREADQRRTEINVAKQRAGSTGTIELDWDGATTTFRNIFAGDGFDPAMEW